MKKRDRLISQHVEDISWNILAAYPHIVRDLIRGKGGVYALYHRDKLYYVGLARDLMRRLNNHLGDRHRGLWDRFNVYLTVNDEHIRGLEALLLRIAMPKGNKARGKVPGSQDLVRSLHKRMRDEDADRRALLLGGTVARRRRIHHASRTKSAAALARAFERRVPLRGWVRDVEYRGYLRTDGVVQYRGRAFESPSSAAVYATKAPRNGWAFWHYKEKSGEWVALRTLRRKRRKPTKRRGRRSARTA